jgi:hypothetical protein
MSIIWLVLTFPVSLTFDLARAARLIYFGWPPRIAWDYVRDRQGLT